MDKDVWIKVHIMQVLPDIVQVRFLGDGMDNCLWLPVGKPCEVPITVRLPDRPEEIFVDPLELDENLDAEDDQYDGGER